MRPSTPSLVNILVPVKRAIDYAVKIRIANDGKGVDTTVKHSMVSTPPFYPFFFFFLSFFLFIHRVSSEMMLVEETPPHNTLEIHCES